MFFEGVHTQFCSIPYALPFDATVVAALQARGGVAIINKDEYSWLVLLYARVNENQ